MKVTVGRSGTVYSAPELMVPFIDVTISKRNLLELVRMSMTPAHTEQGAEPRLVRQLADGTYLSITVESDVDHYKGR